MHVVEQGSGFPEYVAMKYTYDADKRARELIVLEHMKRNPHDNVMQFYGTQGDYFVMEAAYFPSYRRVSREGMKSSLNLAPYCSSIFNLTYEQASAKFQSWFAQLIAGVDHFHNQGFVHGDVKANNVMFFGEELAKLKLVDFGEALTN